MSEHKTGINPVTIPVRGDDNKGLVLARMHVGYGEEGLQKHLSAMMFERVGMEDRGGDVLILDEERFIDALGHLFPHGELSETRKAPQSPEDNQDSTATYSDRLNLLRGLPGTWLPHMIQTLVEEAYKQHVFMPGGASAMVAEVEQRLETTE
jgi:hypothetical protein